MLSEVQLANYSVFFGAVCLVRGFRISQGNAEAAEIYGECTDGGSA